MLGLQVLQLMHQEVELLIADRGLVQYVVSVVVLMQFFPKLFNAFDLVHSRFGFYRMVSSFR